MNQCNKGYATHDSRWEAACPEPVLSPGCLRSPHRPFVCAPSSSLFRNQLQIEAANLHPVARLEDGLLARHPIDNDAIAAPGILNTDSGVVATQLSMVAGNRFMHQTDRVCRITTQLGNAILERPALSAAIPLNHNHCPLATDRLHSGLIRSISRFTEFVEKPAQHIAGS